VKTKHGLIMLVAAVFLTLGIAAASPAHAGKITVNSTCGTPVTVTLSGSPQIVQQVWLNNPWEVTVNACPSYVSVRVQYGVQDHTNFFIPKLCNNTVFTVTGSATDCGTSMSDQ
jgi:hypothetical protein